MTPPLTLESLVGGRVESATLTPETGLVCLSVWTALGVLRLAVGVGPRVWGVGLAPREPSFRAPSRHPLVAALRAHVVGHRVRHVSYEPDDADLWLSVGDERATARARLRPGAQGEVEVLDVEGARVMHWRGEPSRSPGLSVDDALEPAGATLVRASDTLAAELRRAALLKALESHARKLTRRAEAVTEDLSRLDSVEVLQRTGRLLLAQGSKIPRGATRYTLDDWETGGTLEVTLDPATPAKSQAEGYFQKARRIQRGEAVMWARLEATERAREATRALINVVRDVEEVTATSLKAWADEATALGLAQAATLPPRGRARAAPRQPFIEYLGWREQRILVGRGAADNDKLTLRVARPQDLWLHARGAPGAHVVVPLLKGAECPQELLLDAATLAVHHSDLRGEASAEVTWAERRYVRKPKGSATGKVVVDRERVLPLRVEPERLARLLAARREG